MWVRVLQIYKGFARNFKQGLGALFVDLKISSSTKFVVKVQILKNNKI
jgi:hypothetical protein